MGPEGSWEVLGGGRSGDEAGVGRGPVGLRYMFVRFLWICVSPVAINVWHERLLNVLFGNRQYYDALL